MDEKPIDVHFDLSRLAKAQVEEFGLDAVEVIRAVAKPILIGFGDPHYSSGGNPVAIGKLRDGGRVKVNYSSPRDATFIITRIEYWVPRANTEHGLWPC
ncbi:MAG TPA: hypothetical protein VEJ63_01930 [Planctomycetota bacterium]|nr:hypothetical protein [Planctomycetota bacterium]